MMTNTPKILIIYGTTTGNTEVVAQKVADQLRMAKQTVDLENVTEIIPEKLNEYEIIFFGSSTWDDGQLQSDVAEFVEKCQIKNITLANKKLAIFALGDSGYPHFCASAELLANAFSQAQLLNPTLKLDGFPDFPENQSNIDSWVQEKLKQITNAF